jgi:hypothetical protein
MPDGVVIPYRELYCPAHFGNSYEVMWSREMKEMLSEAAYWEFNAYGDWFDAADLKNPRNNPRNERNIPQVSCDHKVESFQTASELGLDLDLVITPNHVYTDQLRDDLLAQPDEEGHMFGQLLCPSIPEAREIILQNNRDIFDDLREAGVNLSYISCCPYDYGGCACGKCDPWIITFLKLVLDIHEVAREYFPEVRPRLIGWWWSKDEHDLVKEWVEANAPDRFHSLTSMIVYGETAPDESLAIPGSVESHAFVHIGYADKAEPKDVYGHWGPTIAANRIPETVRQLETRGYTGYTAYSEGLFDDVNKAMLGALTSGKASDPTDVLREYAERYLGAKGPDREAWAEWIAAWGDPFSRIAVTARREFDGLVKPAKPGWRLDQLEAKLCLFEAHAAILARDEWDSQRFAEVRRWHWARERLWREIWGLGRVRHVFDQRFCRPSWHDEWIEAKRRRI